MLCVARAVQSVLIWLSIHKPVSIAAQILCKTIGLNNTGTNNMKKITMFLLKSENGGNSCRTRPVIITLCHVIIMILLDNLSL